MNPEIKETFQKNKYIHVRDVISKDMANFMTNYMFFKKDFGYLNEPGDDTQCPKSYTIYGDQMFDSLLTYLLPVISDIVGKELLPTYTYSRLYVNGEILKKHTDRPACQYSATLTLGYKQPGRPWHIFFETSPNCNTCIPLDIGEMIIYMGEELPHWRNEFKNEWQVQVFLHYVDKNGPYAKEHIFDGRPRLGCSK